MKAVGIVPGTKQLELLEMDQPKIIQGPQNVDQVLVRIKEVGISAIDRRIASGEPCEPQPGASRLVLGHEMVGRIVDIGPDVKGPKVGDLVVLTVRRGCGLCVPCARGNGDLCLTGFYGDCGIHRLNGFMAPYVLDRVGYVVRIPPDLEDIAVLLGPLSLAEKAIQATISINHRFDVPHPFPEHAYHYPDWGVGKVGLVVGGTLEAIMAALLLRVNSVKTYLMADKTEGGYLSSLVEQAGVTYIQDGKVPTEQLVRKLERIDIIIEATGSPKFNFEITEFMGMGGVLAVTTLPASGAEFIVDGNSYFRKLLSRHQIIFSAISANRRHYEEGIEHLKTFNKVFGSALKKVITHRFPFQDFGAAFASKDPDLVKATLVFEN